MVCGCLKKQGLERPKGFRRERGSIRGNKHSERWTTHFFDIASKGNTFCVDNSHHSDEFIVKVLIFISFAGLHGSMTLLQIVAELAFRSVEHIDVDFAVNAPHASVRSELPMEQMDVGFEFTVAGNPHIVATQLFGGVDQVFIDKLLSDIKHRAFTLPGLHRFRTI